MKGNKGTCSISTSKDSINRTKYDSKKNAQSAYDFHVGMGYCSPDYVIYECMQCGMWHFGKPEWAKLYSKK